MPWKSKQQEKWGNSPTGLKAMGPAKVHEFNAATKGKPLPRQVAAAATEKKMRKGR